MAQVLGADLVVKCLFQEGINYVFGLPGGQICPILDVIKRGKDTYNMEFVMARHEQSAANMADAYARLTGKPGVCIGTVGPGAAYLVPGVYSAWADSIPLIVITGQHSTTKSYPDHGSMQGLDQVSLFRPITKWSTRVEDAKRISELMQRAFRVALSGNPGPVHLDLHVNILTSIIDDETLPYKIVEPKKYRAIHPPLPQKSLLREAGKMLIEAKRPLIHIGGGVLQSKASKEIKELVEYLSMPITASHIAAGAVSEDHPLYLINYIDGALQAQKEADVILLVGCRFDDMDSWGGPPFYGNPDEQKVIQVDISQENIALNHNVEIALVGDARVTLSALSEEISAITEPLSERVELSKYKEAEETRLTEYENFAVSENKPIHPLRLIRDVRGFFPRDAICILDGGNIVIWSKYMNHIYEPGAQIVASDSGSLGGGISYAISAKLVKPDNMVFAICGDGSFGANMQELETASRLNLPIIFIVGNDRQWGLIKSVQHNYFDKRYNGVDFTDIRYDEVAQAIGCFGKRVEDPKKIVPVLQEAVDSGKPAVIDIIIDPLQNLNPPTLETLHQIWVQS
jgi:acetolactate synthase-1/2/3 large subunit